MKTCRRLVPTLTAVAALALALPAAAQAPGRVGIRAGAGADITGGVAGGGQVDYTLFQGDNALEVGALLFYGKFTEDSNNGFNDYHEETTVFVFGAIANYLFRHSMDVSGPYFVAGTGVGAFSVSWREESPTDSSLGPPFGPSGSFQEEDGVVGGFILNFGIGQRLTDMIDLRLQAPTFIVSSGDERDGAVVPTLTLTLGIGF